MQVAKEFFSKSESLKVIDFDIDFTGFFLRSFFVCVHCLEESVSLGRIQHARRRQIRKFNPHKRVARTSAYNSPVFSVNFVIFQLVTS